MFSTKQTVLPNFLKALTIAAMTLGAATAFAGPDGEEKEKIKDMKDMSSSYETELKAEELKATKDYEAVEGELSEEAKQKLREQAEERASTVTDPGH